MNKLCGIIILGEFMQIIQELVPFNTACEQFITGKYILADSKIASILNIVTISESIKEIISCCLDNFNFSTCISSQNVDGKEIVTFNLPTNENDIVASVYSLLNSFKSNKINFYDFISSNFPEENGANDSFYQFAKHIIQPFQNALNSIYSKRHILVETDEYQKNIFNRIKTNVKLILSNMNNYKLKLNQKEEFTMMLNSLYFASEKNDKQLVYSLMIGIDYFSKCNKKIRNVYLSLEECFV